MPPSKEVINHTNSVGSFMLIFFSELFWYFCGNSGKPASCCLFKHFSWGWNQPGAGVAFLTWRKRKHSGESARLFTSMWSKVLRSGNLSFLRREPCKFLSKHLVPTVWCPLYVPKVGSDWCSVPSAVTMFYFSNLDMFGFLTHTHSLSGKVSWDC